MTIEDFERKAAERRRRKQAAIDEIQAVLRTSKALRGQTFGSHPHPRMAIVTGETADRDVGELRVTFFADDGPMGHATRKTEEEIADAIYELIAPPYTAMTEAEVIEWTTTPAYEIGSRQVAYVQAVNSLSWYASQAGRRDLFDRAYDAAELVLRGGRTPAAYEQALDILHEAIRQLPRRNPARALVRNPAWVTSALADHYAVLDDKVPTRWMPQLANVTPDRRKLVADLVEYGCGAYGCVLATNDPNTVLKVTTDDTEAEFAAELAPTLAAPICVTYHLVVRLSAKHKQRPIHLLWRESADLVGKLAAIAPAAEELVAWQHRCAQAAYEMLLDEGVTKNDIRRALSRWVQAVDDMHKDVLLRPLARGLLKVWEDQRIFFGDIHVGNLGVVKRNAEDTWVITDPGHVAVIEDPDLWG